MPEVRHAVAVMLLPQHLLPLRLDISPASIFGGHAYDLQRDSPVDRIGAIVCRAGAACQRRARQARHILNHTLSTNAQFIPERDVKSPGNSARTDCESSCMKSMSVARKGSLPLHLALLQVYLRRALACQRGKDDGQADARQTEAHLADRIQSSGPSSVSICRGPFGFQSKNPTRPAHPQHGHVSPIWAAGARRTTAGDGDTNCSGGAARSWAGRRRRRSAQAPGRAPSRTGSAVPASRWFPQGCRF